MSTPAIEAEARTAAAMADGVNRAELRLAILREAQCQAGVDAPNPYHYEIMFNLYGHVTDAVPVDERREFALAWLRRHKQGISEMAARLGQRVTFDKFATDSVFGIKTTIHHRLHDSIKMGVSAQVDSALTCEYVETGEVEVIPAKPETVVPKLKRVCPPSIFAGVENEVEWPTGVVEVG